MQLLYLHGLAGDDHCPRGQWLADYCDVHHPHIQVVRPNLNQAPAKNFVMLQQLIAQEDTLGIVGCSFGGYSAILCSNLTGVKTVLVNPSVKPHYTFSKRFFKGKPHTPETVGHVTQGGWHMTRADIAWLKANSVEKAVYPKRLLVLLKQGDEVLDYRIARDFYSHTDSRRKSQSHIMIEPNGDHFFSDFTNKIPIMMQFLLG